MILIKKISFLQEGNRYKITIVTSKNFKEGIKTNQAKATLYRKSRELSMAVLCLPYKRQHATAKLTCTQRQSSETFCALFVFVNLKNFEINLFEILTLS